MAEISLKNLEARIEELEELCADVVHLVRHIADRIDDRGYVAYQHLGPGGVAWQAGVVTTAHWPEFSAADPGAVMIATPTAHAAAFAMASWIENHANEEAGNV